jgi:hypothetical protein
MMFPTHRMLMFYCIVVIIFLASLILFYPSKKELTWTPILGFWNSTLSFCCLDPIEPDCSFVRPSIGKNNRTSEKSSESIITGKVCESRRVHIVDSRSSSSSFSFMRAASFSFSFSNSFSLMASFSLVNTYEGVMLGL